MKCCWLTDTHLNTVSLRQRQAFYQSIIDSQAENVLITGDISEGPIVAEHLQELQRAINRPVYFILGNHDYFGARFQEIQDLMVSLHQDNSNLIWLPLHKYIKLSEGIALIGQDGYPDLRYGRYDSSFPYPDRNNIVDLQMAVNDDEFIQVVHSRADTDAKNLSAQIQATVAEGFSKIICATHVPPFPSAAWYKGKPNSEDRLPYFTCKAIGDVLFESANRFIECDFQVYCGHTHTQRSISVLNNLHVHVGMAKTSAPSIVEIIQ